MFDIGGGELLLIILVVLLLFGPKKIPEIARSLGKGMAHLRRAQAEFQRNINEVSADVERTAGLKDDPRPFRPKPSAGLPAGDTSARPGPNDAGNEEQTPKTETGQTPFTVRPAEGSMSRPARQDQKNTGNDTPEKP